MKKLFLALAAAASLAVVPACGAPDAPETSGCCKVCKTGKACGDSCISKDYTCHKPPGCACNG